MRTYKVSNVFHKVFDDKEELPSGIGVVPDWRQADIGDWVEADDGCVIQILRKGEMKATWGKNRIRHYVGTCTGTFLCTPKNKMDTSKRENVWSLSGKNTEKLIFDRKTLTKKEVIFTQFVAKGLSLQESYLRAFDTKNARYALEQSAKLMKTERVKKAVKEELKPVLKELNIDDKTVLKGIKEVAEGDEKAETRLKALFKLADILDLEDKTQTKVTQLSGAVFQGFGDNVLTEVQRPKEIGNGND
tara:strand:- start:893 stop:1630 length:738 start_codon:yes stop_codon:yes gene_type:complete